MKETKKKIDLFPSAKKKVKLTTKQRRENYKSFL